MQGKALHDLLKSVILVLIITRKLVHEHFYNGIKVFGEFVLFKADIGTHRLEKILCHIVPIGILK